MSKMLISKYINENQNGIKLICRATNIAHWFTQNFAEHAGTLVSLKDIRSEIVNEIGIKTKAGDLKVHGRAVSTIGLNLSTVSGENCVEISLINLKRCASFLLGRGRVSHWLTEIKEPAVSDSVESDNDLIDQGVSLDSSNLTEFEYDFTRNLDKKCRDRELSHKQRTKLIQIINERS